MNYIQLYTICLYNSIIEIIARVGFSNRTTTTEIENNLENIQTLPLRTRTPHSDPFHRFRYIFAIDRAPCPFAHAPCPRAVNMRPEIRRQRSPSVAHPTIGTTPMFSLVSLARSLTHPSITIQPSHSLETT